MKETAIKEVVNFGVVRPKAFEDSPEVETTHLRLSGVNEGEPITADVIITRLECTCENDCPSCWVVLLGTPEGEVDLVHTVFHLPPLVVANLSDFESLTDLVRALGYEGEISNRSAERLN